MTLIRRSAAAAFMTLSLLTGFLTFEVRPAFAQDAGLEAVGAEIGLSAEDPRIIAARIINVALGLLGIIVLVIVLYAGFQWMTAGGDAAKVEEAKARLRNGIIGLIIILSAYAITAFVVRSLTEATGFGDGTGVGPGPGPGPLPGGGGATAFQLRSITPSGAIPLRNVEVRFLFTRDVDPATASAAIRVLRASDGAEVAGAVTVDGSNITFVPNEPCPAPNEDRRCFEADTEFVARVLTSLRSSTGSTIVCGGFAPACEGRFTTGSLVDTAPPTAVIEYPLDGQSIPVDDLIFVRTRATDDSGISHIDTFVNGSRIGSGTGPDSSSPFVAEVEWDTSGLSPGSRSLMSRAFDLDSNTADSASVSVAVRPRHCFNGIQDADETGVDCGGSCGACSGGSCTSGSMCASGVCVGGVCVEQPVITGVTPDDGRVGTLVSITGANFGTTPGIVTFADGRTATAPAACAAAGVSTWSPTLVIVSVPEGAVDGPISITNVSSGLSDATNDDRGPVLDDFDVNDVARPGLCAVLPSSGIARDSIELVGVDLGSSSGRVHFNDREISSFTSWNPSSIEMNAPVLSPATYAVRATVSGVQSNAVAFRLNEPVVTAPPIIDDITPSQGPISEYITLQGRNFGSRVGRVLFRLGDGEGVASTDFPDRCALAFWQDTSVTVKVPATYRAGLGDSPVTPGAWRVVLERQDGVQSAEFGFTVNTDTPRPGICAILPSAGPVGTPIEIIGERFGTVAGGRATFAGPGDTRVPMSVAAADWSGGRVAGPVPAGAITGQVQVSQSGVDSNLVPFAVRNCNEDASICAVGEVCCRTGACSVGGTCPASSPEAEFAWQLSTGILPINPRVVEECSPDRPASPSPWGGRTGGDRACVNTDLFIRFTTPLNPTSIVRTGPDATFLVRKCIGPEESPCSDASDPVAPAPGFGPLVGVEGDPATGNGFLQFRPALPWDGNSIYQVILTTGIRSNTDVPMLQDASRCGAGNAYCFTFGTRSATDTCRIGSINVVPESATLSEIGQTQREVAVPRAADDICLNLRADAYDWTWTTGDSRVEISDDFETLGDGSRRTLEVQQATARGETGSESVPVTASVTQDGETVSGIGRVFVRLQPPRVVSYGPSCDAACLNAAIWAKFNVAIDEATVRASNIRLRRCVNENCLSYDRDLDLNTASIRLIADPLSTSDAATYLLVEPTAADGSTLLEIGRFYRVTLRGGDMTGIRSTNALPLAGLNDPEGFTWTFRVNTGDEARCTTARVDVVPARKYETTVGARQTFVASPVSGPNACDAGGSPLISDRTFAWSIDQSGPVSRFVNGGTGAAIGAGLVDTTRIRPPGCSGNCLHLGSDGVFGQTASCGNGIVETTNPRYCSGGRTPFGDPCVLLPPGSRGAEECDEATSLCGPTCLWQPMFGGTCGNGVLDRGEQCDAGPGGGRGCSAECQLLGSRAGGSTCGNGDVAAGEACDYGSVAPGGGCSADCLHEGSRRVRALCGNGVLEPGESCERPAPGAPFPAGCNPQTCLNEGTAPPLCGNGVRDPGEDCDDGNLVNGDGCSARCLFEGSSAGYPVPSFCGDGVRGRGEQCEAPAGGDGRPDPLQLAEILGEAEPDADGRMTSRILAEYDTRTGNAEYGLQCGFREESSCPAGHGLDMRGCCALRPVAIGLYPPNGERDICRNVMISATFNVPMDEGSLQANFVLAEEVIGDVCPDGLERVSRIEDFDPTPGVRAWARRTWQRLLAWFRPSSAEAAWCAGSSRGRLIFEPEGAGTRASFVLENALKANTDYLVMFRGDSDLTDNADVANRVGIRSTRGVVANGNLIWNFRTGATLCTVTAIHVRDTNADSPNLFTRAGESHLYAADVVSLQDGRRIALSPVAEYTWTWEPWIASDRDVLEAEPGVGSDAASRSNVTVADPPRNGASFVEAGIRIVRDDVNVPSTIGRIVKGTQNATVLLCEEPWPPRAQAPFTEMNGHPSLALLGTSPEADRIRASGPYFNFATMYCKDAGAPGTEGDLPSMNVQPVEVTPADRDLGILRQYLFTYDRADLLGDGIGIRIATNPLHLSPSAWYASRGFTGSPEATVVDGYEAVKDGTTWYVAAVNTDDAFTAPVYSQIYILSHNPDAKPETRNIVQQMVDAFTLNANIQNGASNACVYAVADGDHVPGEFYRGSDGRVARCTADWECLAQNPNLRCASFKSKMQRDSKRIVDFQFMTNAIEASRDRSGTYPRLQAGTFVPTISTSRWPSWSAQLQSEVGATFPTDPVNRFLSCGRCSESGAPCQDASECPAGQACVAATGGEGVEPATCWNPDLRQYQCPQLTPGVPESVSRLYQYRAVNAGERFELATELEGAISTRYVPPLLTEVRRCSNIDAPCAADADCRILSSAGIVLSSGTCNATGGRWRYHAVCDTSAVYGVGGNICGDGVIGSTELCEIGDTQAAACAMPDGSAGTKLQICDDCQRFIDGPATTCVANVQCGNGRVDAGEICDDGALNGTYGRCNRTCTGYDAFCGDGRISPGERCDLGLSNGLYCRSGCDAATSCNLSCTGPGPRCGDGIVNGPEQCDGNAERTTSALCQGPTNPDMPCETDAECGEDPLDRCGGIGPFGYDFNSCVGVTARRCTNDRTRSCTTNADCGTAPAGEPPYQCLTYPTARVRTCKAYGGTDPAPEWCTWNTWTGCEPVGYCGDGIVDPGEECDDGNRNNNDACTNSCRRNVCGDGIVHVGVEECDQGVNNGRRTCTADYGSSCLSCSTSCRHVASSGGFCGNGVREGSEQCDGTQGLGSCSGDPSRSCLSNGDCLAGQTCNLISCRSLGFDYARNIVCAHYGYYRNTRTGEIVCVGETAFACRFSLTPETVWTEASLTPASFPILEANRVCMPNQSECAPGTLCAQPHPNRRDGVMCTSACGYSGCQMCGDEPGDGVIEGQVFDAVYFNQPVPNARVTLYNRGVRVGDPTFTDGDGRFRFAQLDAHSACVNYRIIVDFYQDNPCTGVRPPGAPTCNGAPSTIVTDVDESVYGGYWPFESRSFGVSTFRSAGLRNDAGRIYLTPRVAPDETLVVHTWNGTFSSHGGSYIDAHLVVPRVQNFRRTGPGPSATLQGDDTYVICSLGDASCQRVINYAGSQGNYNMNLPPHANLFCFDTTGTNDSCNSFAVAPQTMKFKRGTWANTDRYSYYLVDYSPSRPSYQYFDATQSSVRIITFDRVYTVDAPVLSAPPCTPSSGNPNGQGKYWLVFQQDAFTGAVTIRPVSEQLRCAGQDSFVNPDGVVNLPNPLTGVGS